MRPGGIPVNSKVPSSRLDLAPAAVHAAVHRALAFGQLTRALAHAAPPKATASKALAPRRGFCRARLTVRLVTFLRNLARAGVDPEPGHGFATGQNLAANHSTSLHLDDDVGVVELDAGLDRGGVAGLAGP